MMKEQWNQRFLSFAEKQRTENRIKKSDGLYIALRRATDIGKIECKVTSCLSGVRTKESPVIAIESGAFFLFLFRPI